MTFDSAALQTLFRDSRMFDSRKDWQRAGFSVFDRSSDTKIMAATHPSMKGYLFKKYVNDIDLDKQRRNYERRIEGADKVRSFILRRQLRRVVVPHKWLYELPKNFGTKKERSYVLIVEHLRLLSDSASAYYRIDTALLKELCTVLFEFRGLDSAVMNVPFIDDGRLAFIDTEHWDRRSDNKPYLDHIQAYLSHDSQKLAKKIFGALEDGDDLADVRRDREDRSEDFADEEDTSSSSSSS